MIVIDQVLISEEIVEQHFVCKLESCKGACCWKGEFGAPLEREEKDILAGIYPNIRDFLSRDSQNQLDKGKPYRYYRGMSAWGTALLDNGACVFMTRDARGIAQCGIEQAWMAGKTQFQKPISCHLYPIRVKVNKKHGFVALNYDRWDICQAACHWGKAHKMPVFQFVKNGIIRKFGHAFFNALDSFYQTHIKSD